MVVLTLPLLLLLLLGVVFGPRPSTASGASWKSLPKLYDYDDFDECRSANPDYRYCVVQMNIVANESSAMWQQIKQHSADPRHFRRDVLELGICLDIGCDSTKESGNKTELAQQCGIDRVWRLYHLNATGLILSCASGDDDLHKTDFADVLFSIITVIILALVIMSTVIDVKDLPLRENLLLKSFSLGQNLKKLASLNSRSRRDLLFLDGARVLTMLIILLCHLTIPMIRIPLKNPEVLEQQFDNFWSPIGVASSTNLVQLFFVIGGVVLVVNFLDHIKAHPEFKFTYFLDRVINRLIRILPVYAFVVLFQASWYRTMKDGPIADRYRDHCHEYWWTNLLFVNNYVRASEPCLQYTWYLGADFQLFLAGTTIMMILWKFPTITRHLVLVMTAFAFVVPAVVIYFYNLDATVMVLVRFMIEGILNLEYYLKAHITCETNAANYFFGMIVGIAYHSMSENAKKLEQLRNFKLWFLFAAVFFVAIHTMTVLLPRDQLEHPSIVLAIFGTLLKSSWGLLASCLILYLAFRPRCLLAAFLQHPIMLVAAKLSYCMYVVQYTVVHAVYRQVTNPLTKNAFTSILFTSAILLLTLLMGLMLHLCIEVPFMSLLRPVFETNSQQKQQLANGGGKKAVQQNDQDQQTVLNSESHK